MYKKDIMVRIKGLQVSPDEGEEAMEFVTEARLTKEGKLCIWCTRKASFPECRDARRG